MLEIIKSSGEDKKRILCLANEAFGEEVEPGGFAALLPKLYGPKADCEGNHLLLLEDGRLKALLLMETQECRILYKELRTGAIGTVAVAPDSRGKGYMRLLMDEGMRQLREKGCTWVSLGGQRQRYAPWGFEPAGIACSYVWNENKIRACSLTLESMDRESGRTEEAWLWWGRKSIGVRRSREAFYDTLCSWGGQPFALIKEGKYVGYAVLKEEGETAHILELEAEEGIKVQDILRAYGEYLASHKESPLTIGIRQGKITAAAYRQGLLRQLENICEQEYESCCRQYLILDWRETLEALLAVKASYQTLEDGCRVLKILGESGIICLLEICAEAGHARVKQLSEGTPDLELKAGQACRMLLRSSQIAYKELECFPAGWFPLPLFTDMQDCC